MPGKLDLEVCRSALFQMQSLDNPANPSVFSGVMLSFFSLSINWCKMPYIYAVMQHRCPWRLKPLHTHIPSNVPKSSTQISTKRNQRNLWNILRCSRQILYTPYLYIVYIYIWQRQCWHKNIWLIFFFQWFLCIICKHVFWIKQNK